MNRVEEFEAAENFRNSEREIGKFFLIYYDGLKHSNERASSRSEVMVSMPVIFKLCTWEKDHKYYLSLLAYIVLFDVVLNVIIRA